MNKIKLKKIIIIITKKKKHNFCNLGLYFKIMTLFTVSKTQEIMSWKMTYYYK